MINPQFIRSSCCYAKPAQNSTVKSTLLSCNCNWLQQTPVGWVTARSLLNLIQVYSRGTYHKTEAPFGWKNQCWALDGLIHGCLQGMVAYVHRHAQNSPPFCCNQRGFAEEREREKQTGLMIIKLLSLLVWIITLCHQPRQKAVTF